MRQRRRDDAVGGLARLAHADATWPFRTRDPDLIARHIALTLGALVMQDFKVAWGEYQSSTGRVGGRHTRGPFPPADAPVDVVVDWASFAPGAFCGTPKPETQSDAEGCAAPADHMAGDRGSLEMERLGRETDADDPAAARRLLVQARRHGDLDSLRRVRDHAQRVANWPLLCELLATGGEAILDDTFEEARALGDRYLLDRTLELGSERFLRRVYDDARASHAGTSEDVDDLHIALAALKALAPKTWQAMLPPELRHAANIMVPHGKIPATLPALPTCLTCLAPDGVCLCGG